MSEQRRIHNTKANGQMITDLANMKNPGLKPGVKKIEAQDSFLYRIFKGTETGSLRSLWSWEQMEEMPK